MEKGLNSSYSSVSERRDVKVGEQDLKPSKFAKEGISSLDHATVLPNCSVFKNKRWQDLGLLC